MDASLIYGLSCCFSSLCCLMAFVIFLFIIGRMVMKKKGKEPQTVKDTIKVGADVTRGFIRGTKSREQLLREAELEDDD